MKLKSTFIASSLALLVAACAPANPLTTHPAVTNDPEVFGQSNTSVAAGAKLAFKPEVDILFVIDNSDSMAKHQEKLKANIDKFVAAFEANKRIDFHIGVTTVWDSIRFGPIVKEGFHPLGGLYPVVGAPTTNFVTRIPGYTQILGNTLKIGVVPRGTDAHDLGGPEFEELFSPVVAAIDGRNPGFIRPEAHLAVILMTDADDVSSVSPSKLAAILQQSKNYESSMISTYAVLSISPSCPKDPGNDPRKMPAGYKLNGQINEFLKDTHGRSFDLCDEKYGTKLAAVGTQIAQNASKSMKIQLDQVPEDGTLALTFSSNGDAVPFQYDPYNYTVTIPSSAMDGRPDDEQIGVNYTPVDFNRLGTDRTKSSL